MPLAANTNGMACPLQARIDHLLSFGTPAQGYPWATARQLEGRSTFEAFCECVQPGRGQQISTAAVAAAVLIASGHHKRKQACDHCKIPEGGARSRVGALANQIKQAGCAGCLPELPDDWAAPPVPPAAPAKQLKHKRKVDKAMAQPWSAELVAKHGYQREKAVESSALSPQKTRRIHVLQHNTPEGGCELSTYPADATPFEEAKQARSRRLSTNRERRCQAFKVRVSSSRQLCLTTHGCVC